MPHTVNRIIQNCNLFLKFFLLLHSFFFFAFELWSAEKSKTRRFACQIYQNTIRFKGIFEYNTRFPCIFACSSCKTSVLCPVTRNRRKKRFLHEATAHHAKNDISYAKTVPKLLIFVILALFTTQKTAFYDSSLWFIPYPQSIPCEKSDLTKDKHFSKLSKTTAGYT